MITFETKELIAQKLGNNAEALQIVFDYLDSHDYVTRDFISVVRELMARRNIDDSDSKVYKFFRNGEELLMFGLDDTRLKSDTFVKLLTFFEYEKTSVSQIEFREFLRLMERERILPRFDDRQSDFLSELNKPNIYEEMVSLYENYGVTKETIINYCFEQTGTISKKMFHAWFEYAKMCKQYNSQDLAPENLLFSINDLRVKNGIEPEIYSLSYLTGDRATLQRSANKVIMKGLFPVDPSDNSLKIEWMKIYFEAVDEITLVKTRNRYGRVGGKMRYEVQFNLTPDTIIMLSDEDYRLTPSLASNDNKLFGNIVNWVCFYEGPSRVEIDREVLVKARKQVMLTQKQAAKAINVGARTLQSWEAEKGGSPDMEALLRLMVLYGINNISIFFKKKTVYDFGMEFFKSKKPLKEIFPIQYESQLSPGDNLIETIRFNVEENLIEDDKK